MCVYIYKHTFTSVLQRNYIRIYTILKQLEPINTTAKHKLCLSLIIQQADSKLILKSLIKTKMSTATVKKEPTVDIKIEPASRPQSRKSQRRATRKIVLESGNFLRQPNKNNPNPVKFKTEMKLEATSFNEPADVTAALIDDQPIFVPSTPGNTIVCMQVKQEVDFKEDIALTQQVEDWTYKLDALKADIKMEERLTAALEGANRKLMEENKQTELLLKEQEEEKRRLKDATEQTEIPEKVS